MDEEQLKKSMLEDLARTKAAIDSIKNRIGPGGIAHLLVTVQPMAIPNAAIFFMDYEYGGAYDPHWWKTPHWNADDRRTRCRAVRDVVKKGRSR